MKKLASRLSFHPRSDAPSSRSGAPRPIFVATQFKSGTKLLEHIVEKLTGLSAHPLGMEAGSDYESADPIAFEAGEFFIWHNVPGERVKARIREANARPVFLIRNIYDLLVSQYHHFAADVDAAVGHSTQTTEYFASMTRSEGICLVLCGATSKQFHWNGFGYQLWQIQEMLKFSKEYPCHVMSYDRLVLSKAREMDKLARFLELEVSPSTIAELLDSSAIDAMRAARVAAVGSGDHFRKGTPGDHVNELAPLHYHMINHLILTFAPMLPTLCAELGFADIVDARGRAS
ncbi:MAG: sulfotransferase domain-containing protein [Sulfuritalea sp.]|nr:sulfotransferase domain-containing protein [Sulfuritalea sp.]